MRMDLNFLGCGSAFNPLYGNTSAYFTNKDQLYVIDGGESVFLKLYQKELLKKYAGITIMVTHMHADHVGSLPSIISYCYYVLGKKVTVIYPEKSLWILLGLMGIDPDIYIPVESSLFTLHIEYSCAKLYRHRKGYRQYRTGSNRCQYFYQRECRRWNNYQY